MKRTFRHLMGLWPVIVALVAASVFSSPASGQTLLTMNHRVIDAEYNKQLDRIITVSSAPANALHIVDPVSGTDTVVALLYVPTCVSVAPDGAYAAVGHDARVSYVDLNSGALVKTYTISTEVKDIVLAGNGYVYAISRTDQLRIHCLNLQTGIETLSSGDFLYYGAIAKLHPNGTRIYGADNGLSSTNMRKYDISGGTATKLYDAPYLGNYPVCGNLWISEDGLRIFTKCGVVSRSSDTQSEDMLYDGSLSDLSSIQHLTDSLTLNKVAAIQSNSSYGTVIKDAEVWVYEYDPLGFFTKTALPAFPANGKKYQSHGKFVFFNSDGTKLFAIVQADATSGTSLDFAVASFKLGTGGKFIRTVTASSGPGGTTAPSGNIEILDGESITFTISAQQDHVIWDVLVDDVSVGAPTSYKFENIAASHTITVVFAPTANTSPYYPLLPGATWTYQKNDGTTEKVTILKNMATVKGVKTAQAQYSSNKAADYYTNDASGIRLHGEYSPRIYRNRAGTMTMIPPITMALSEAKANQTTHSSGAAHLSVPGLGSADAAYSADWKVDGFETVTVPAGTFEALKLSYSLTMSGVTETGTLYLAKNIGEIKQTNTVSGATTTHELVSTNVNVRDLAVTSITAPALITFTKKVTSKTSPVKVAIQNRGPFPQTITNSAMLSSVVTLTVESLGSCANPAPVLASPTNFPLTIASKGSLTVTYNVTFNCVNDASKTTTKDPLHNDYRFIATVSHAAIDGNADTHAFDDTCPRTVTPPYVIDPYPDGTIKDMGCGAKKKDGTYGDDVATDIVVSK
jgi:hypothetical protein